MRKGSLVLFGGNRLGYVGLAFVIGSTILALASPLVIVKYPDWWGAPEDETVQLTKLWPLASNNSNRFDYSPINHTVAARIVPGAAETRSDRIYVAAGTKLYALDSAFGTSEWTAPPVIDFAYIDPRPLITAGPVVANYGDYFRGPGNFLVYVATQSGAVYALNDTVSSSGPPPQPESIGVMDGPATGLAVFSGDSFFRLTEYDMVAATSARGTVYIWKVSSTGHIKVSNISVSTAPARIASGPMRGATYYPMFSPVFYFTPSNYTRPWMYVSSEDGNLTAIDIRDTSSPHIEWSKRLTTEGVPWTTAPMVDYVSNPPITSTVVFAATDEGHLWALYATNGTSLPGWGGPRHVGRDDGVQDTGRMTQPNTLRGTTELSVGSSSGYVYVVDYLSTDDDGGNVHLEWWFRDFFNPEGSTRIDSIQADYGSALVFVASNADRGRPGPSPEDEGTLFALNVGSGARIWYVFLGSSIPAGPMATDLTMTAQSAVFVGTHGGSVYSYAVTGLITYNSNYFTCHGGGKALRGTLCTKYTDVLMISSSVLAVAGAGAMGYAAVKGPRKPSVSEHKGPVGNP